MLENILSICVHFSVMAALYQTNIFFRTTQIKLKILLMMRKRHFQFSVLYLTHFLRLCLVHSRLSLLPHSALHIPSPPSAQLQSSLSLPLSAGVRPVGPPASGGREQDVVGRMRELKKIIETIELPPELTWERLLILESLRPRMTRQRRLRTPTTRTRTRSPV